MPNDIVVLGGSSHPHLVEVVCNQLGIAPTNTLLGKFSVGETRVEIKDSVRGKDVFVIQSGHGSGKVNDNIMELLIVISACKTASAQRITAVLPYFPYSRPGDDPENKGSAPIASSSKAPKTHSKSGPLHATSSNIGDGTETLIKSLANVRVDDGPSNSAKPNTSDDLKHRKHNASKSTSNKQENDNTASLASSLAHDEWIVDTGPLIADLLVCAGTDHVITMDLHDPQYHGYFDIPVDNVHGREILKNYIQQRIPDYKHAVIVGPDASDVKRANAIADSLGMRCALFHKNATRKTDRQNVPMTLVGNVSRRVAIIIDDMADTSHTIIRAARYLKREGATKVYALITHGVLSGDAIERINSSKLDKIVVTNTIPQTEHKANCPKLEVLEVGHVFAETIRRVHHGESVSAVFQ